MKRILRSAVSLLLCAAVALGGTACGRSKLPTTITIWTYYNGDQLECFNQLVEQFNSTVGKEKNIRVESSSQGSVNDLAVQTALNCLRLKLREVKVLGSYPIM